MHGQSDYTPTKQVHLAGILKTCAYAWNPTVNGKTGWAHPDVICIDCTSGSGHAESGELGSPLLINEWALRNYGHNFRQLACERVPQSYARLIDNNLPQADIELGEYQEKAQAWLESLSITRPALGFVYCDPNGAKDLVEGLDFFRWLAQDARFRRLDLIFHWSMNAYARNASVGNAWAQAPVMDVVDQLVGLKSHAYMREPLTKWQWVFLQVMNTDKVKPVWKEERILPYREWCGLYSRRFTDGLQARLFDVDQGASR